MKNCHIQTSSTNLRIVLFKPTFEIRNIEYNLNFTLFLFLFFYAHGGEFIHNLNVILKIQLDVSTINYVEKLPNHLVG